MMKKETIGLSIRSRHCSIRMSSSSKVNLVIEISEWSWYRAQRYNFKGARWVLRRVNKYMPPTLEWKTSTRKSLPHNMMPKNRADAAQVECLLLFSPPWTIIADTFLPRVSPVKKKLLPLWLSKAKMAVKSDRELGGQESCIKRSVKASLMPQDQQNQWTRVLSLTFWRRIRPIPS